MIGNVKEINNNKNNKNNNISISINPVKLEYFNFVL